MIMPLVTIKNDRWGVGDQPIGLDDVGEIEMNRDNDRWITDLRDGGKDRERALSDLRDILLRNLRKSQSSWFVDESLVEDAVQDSLVRILERLEQFEGRSQFVTWATAIAIRVVMGELRRTRWRDVSLEEVMSDAKPVVQLAIDPQLTPDAQAERRAIFSALEDAIENCLTDRQRTALVAELKGMPQDEIARHLGSNRNAIYKLTHDARKKLKKELEAAGYTAADAVTTIAG